MRALDGPAQDAALSLRACPVFLRVTIGPGGKVDALDRPGDEPEADEVVYAYRIVPGTWSCAFICGRRPRSASGRYEFGDYRLIDPQPEPEILIDRQRWVEWVVRAEGAPA